jgi:uncharacterized protein
VRIALVNLRLWLPALLVIASTGLSAVRVVQVRGRGLVPIPYLHSRLQPGEATRLAARGWRLQQVPSSTPGVLLQAAMRPPAQAGRPWVLFFQGNSHRLMPEAAAFLEALAGKDDLGLAVMAWRGFDGSQGQPGREPLLADAVAFTRQLREGEARGAPLHVTGFSLGTMAAVASVRSLQALPPGERAASLSLLAPFTALQMYEGGSLRRYFTAEDWDALPLAQGLRLPALVVHGSADETLPVAMGREMAAALGARFVEVPGQAHLALLQDPRALEAVRALVLAQK